MNQEMDGGPQVAQSQEEGTYLIDQIEEGEIESSFGQKSQASALSGKEQQLADRLKNIQSTEARVQEHVQMTSFMEGSLNQTSNAGPSQPSYIGMGRGKSGASGPGAFFARQMNQTFAATADTTNLSMQDPSFFSPSPIQEQQPMQTANPIVSHVTYNRDSYQRVNPFASIAHSKPNIIRNMTESERYQVTIPIQRPDVTILEEDKEEEYVNLPPQNMQMHSLTNGMKKMMAPSENEMIEFLMWKQERNFMHGLGQRSQARFEDLPDSQGRETFKATRSMFSGKMKSKVDFYRILQKEGQIYLPPFDECPIAFLKDLVMGKKKYFFNNQIMIIDVPFFEELSTKQLFDQIKQVPVFQLYLPDLDDAKRPPNRKYMYNIVNTIDPEFFPKNIQDGYRQRKERFENQGNEEFEVDRNLFELIKNSNQIVHKRGRVLGYLGGEDKKRKLQRAEGEDNFMMDAATGSKREKHKYARAVEIDDSLVQKITEDYERGVFKSSLQSTHQSKRRLL